MRTSTSRAAQPWQESVCASLTELFAPQIHQQRLATWPVHYPWIDPAGCSTSARGFRSRRATSSTACASRSATSIPAPLQERALEILQFKLDILWSMLDAIAAALRTVRDE